MRLLPATMLAGAASAAAPFQQILTSPQKAANSFSKPLQDFQEQLKSLSEEAHNLWDEVSTSFPETMGHNPMFSLPKKHNRRPDSHWDHIVRGADLQNVWVTGVNGQKEREVDGKLEDYDLRIKKSDPSSLGVDPNVKQYTGYLDDNENDKHLFYCKYSNTWELSSIFLLEQGSLSLATTPRMTLLSSG